MKNQKIINEFKKILKFKKKNNELYFSKDSPVISDSDYDILKKEVLNLLKDFPFLKKIFKISSLIGAPPSDKFKKKKHLKPMLSLSNAFNKSDMGDFIKKLKIF